jgi:uncharacterized membrane protein
MAGWIARARLRLETSIWVIPALCLLCAIVLSAVAHAIDGRLSPDDDGWYLFGGGPEGARALLSTLAASLITVTGVVFSVTVLVLQLASNQFSSRALRTFMRDRGPQLVLGIFVGSFLYALLALRTVRDQGETFERNVPALTVWLALVLAFVCIVALIYFIHHIAQSIRVVSVLSRIGDDGRRQLAQLYPDGLGRESRDPERRRPDGPPVAVVPHRGTSGVLVAVDAGALWRAVPPGVTVAVAAQIGDFVARGGPLFEVWGDAGAVDAGALAAATTIGAERTVRQDLLFVFRELVDVAGRALSPGIHDPTTAVQALDQLHDLLRALVRRRFPAPYRETDRGELRLVLPRPDWDAYVALAVDEIRRAGEREIQVVRRLRHLLLDLGSVAPAHRRPPLERELALLDAAVARGFADREDALGALRPGRQGHAGHLKEIGP